jgi:hypothetical protein
MVPAGWTGRWPATRGGGAGGGAAPGGGGPAAPPSHPDAFRYEITLPDEPDRGTAVLGEAEAGDDALVPLMDRLAEAGTLDG